MATMSELENLLNSCGLSESIEPLTGKDFTIKFFRLQILTSIFFEIKIKIKIPS